MTDLERRLDVFAADLQMEKVKIRAAAYAFVREQCGAELTADVVQMVESCLDDAFRDLDEKFAPIRAMTRAHLHD